jgi:alanine-synthesizing transaminase
MLSNISALQVSQGTVTPGNGIKSLSIPEGFPQPDAHRMGLLPRYILGRLNALVGELSSQGVEVFDFGMGNPIDPVQDEVLDEMKIALGETRNHRYSDPRGIHALKAAFSRHYQRHFGVELDPGAEIIQTIGSKDALSHLCLAIVGPSDICAVPSPAYMIHRYAPILSGGHTIGVPIGEENPGVQLLKDIQKVFQTVRPLPKLLILNFPQNPTGKTIALSFFEEVVAMAKFYKFWVINDFAYGHTCFDGYKAPSLLEVKGAKEVGVETFTMSKPYNMAGWRLGFMAGNRILVDLLGKIKSYFDYGQFQCIQLAAIKALDLGDPFIVRQAMVYQKRRDALLEGLEKAGWGPTVRNRAAMFTWQRIPSKFRGMNSIEFCLKLASHTGAIFTPGGGFGEDGEEFVRIALVTTEDRIRKACERIGRYLEHF